MIRAIIFDLDSCIADAREPGIELFRPVFDAIVNANAGALDDDEMMDAMNDMWRIPFDAVAEKHRFTPAMRSSGWAELVKIEVVRPMSGYGDLAVLREFSVLMFLVTSGFRRLQESKIRALGIAPLFQGVFVDAIDEPGRRGKQGIFADIVRSHELTPGDVLVVGDNPESELGAGRRLGMRTVQTLRPGVPCWPAADHHVGNLHELLLMVEGG